MSISSPFQARYHALNGKKLRSAPIQRHFSAPAMTIHIPELHRLDTEGAAVRRSFINKPTQPSQRVRGEYFSVVNEGDGREALRHCPLEYHRAARDGALRHLPMPKGRTDDEAAAGLWCRLKTLSRVSLLH